MAADSFDARRSVPVWAAKMPVNPPNSLGLVAKAIQVIF